MARPLHIPDLVGAHWAIYRSAVDYVRAGWYVGPLLLRGNRRHAGSILGKGWPTATSRDPEPITQWFAQRRERGVFLHVGRSGAIAFDVDTPELLPRLLRTAISRTRPAFQATAEAYCPPFDPYTEPFGRGHYVWALPPSTMFGNGYGALPKDWGEVRGRNGILVAEPTPHAKRGEGGCYRWWSPMVLPELPKEVARALLTAPRVHQTSGYAYHPQYTSRRVDGLLAKLRQAQQGERNSLLFWTACRFGELVAEGRIDEAMIRETLIDIADEIGLPSGEATATTDSGLTTGCWAWSS